MKKKKYRLFKSRISLQPYCIPAGTDYDSVHLSSCLFKILFLKTIFFLIWCVLGEGRHLPPQHPMLLNRQLARVGFLLPSLGPKNQTQVDRKVPLSFSLPPNVNSSTAIRDKI